MNPGNNNLKAMNNNDVIDLKELFLALKNRWKLIIVVTFVTTIISSVYTFCFTTPMYSAKATIYIQGSDGSTVSDIMQGLQLGAQIAPDYEVFFKSRPVVKNVIKSENLDTTVEQLNSQVTITNPSDTHMIVVTVTDSDPQRAADIANAYIEYGIDAVREVVVKEPYVVESAIADNRKVSPSNSKNIMMGFLMGLVLSCGYIIFRTLVDDKLNSNDKIERVLGYNVLASFKEDNSLKMKNNEKKKGKRK